MDPRHHKRSVRFGEESLSPSDQKLQQMDDDSEVPSENEMDGTLRDDRLGLSSSKAAEEEF